jgi:GMP synthase-like glutamine amidotransferase
MKALIVTHHPEEGPGLLEAILRERGWEMDEVGLWNGNSLPDPTPFHLLVLMGGPMSVNEEDLHPFLAKEKHFVRQWINKGNPIVGICLGAQLIAHCLGGKVYKGSREEIGWYKVMLTDEGRRDSCLRSFPVPFPVFQWHAETFDLPKKAVLLATAQDYPHQAFRYRDTIYAFQFHFELTERMIQQWLAESEVDKEKQRSITSSLRLHLPVIHQLCRNFMQSLLDSIEHLTDTRGERSYANTKRNNKPAVG